LLEISASVNAKTAKLFRKYAKEQTETKESAKIAYKKLKSEFRAWETAHR
jgi:hypothetical protein